MSAAAGAARWQSVQLRHGPLVLRPISMSDRRGWEGVRSRNSSWLARWEATRPPELPARPVTFRGMVRELRRQARQNRALPLALLVDGEFAGQVTVNNIVGGSALFASVGYWIDQRHAGRGYMPLAVALVIDHCFTGMGLHRVEVAIRPENSASLRVVEKLQIPEVGYAPRFLHIDGDWRDHRLFALTAEDVPEGLMTRYLSQSIPTPAQNDQESQQ